MAKAATKAKPAAPAPFDIFAGPAQAARTTKVVTSGTQIPIAGLSDLKKCRRSRAAILVLEKDADDRAKEAIAKCFVDAGCRKKGRPENFVGIDGTQTANCQLRAKTFGPNGMDDDPVAEIEAAGLGDF